MRVQLHQSQKPCNTSRIGAHRKESRIEIAARTSAARKRCRRGVGTADGIKGQRVERPHQNCPCGLRRRTGCAPGDILKAASDKSDLNDDSQHDRATATMGLLLPPPNPPVLSLFSASLFPHPTWASRTDRALPDDSLIVVLPSTEPLPAGLVHRTMPGRDITHPTVHIQSPTIPTTSLRCPPSRAEMLGVELDWLNLHLARLGGRELALECTLRDGNGVEGRVRCGTFTVSGFLSAFLYRPARCAGSPMDGMTACSLC